MRPPFKVVAILFILVGVFLSFFAGRWTGRMAGTLRAEADYPWQLHRKIARADLSCGKLRSAAKTGRFLVEPLDDGSMLLIVSFDPLKQLVTAFVIDSSGRYASDSWPLSCK
jgi:hypothetical protein